jgi:hypothetical protein
LNISFTNTNTNLYFLQSTPQSTYIGIYTPPPGGGEKYRLMSLGGKKCEKWKRKGGKCKGKRKKGERKKEKGKQNAKRVELRQ